MNERGGASIALLGVIAVALVLAVGLAAVGTWLRARTEANAAADAAALAAAPVTFLPFGAKGTPAEEAARFAAINDTRLVWCVCPPDPSWEPRTVEVEVEREVEIWPLGTFIVKGRGRAEFVPSLLLEPSGSERSERSEQQRLDLPGFTLFAHLFAPFASVA